MAPQNFMFGGGSSGSTLHPLVLAVMVVTVLLMFCLPKRHVIVPFLLTIFLFPYGQCVVLGGVHLFVSRVLVIFGLVHLFTAGSTPSKPRLASGFNRIDRAFVCYNVISALAFVLLWTDSQALVNKLGSLMDALGGYFYLRFLIRGKEDVRRAIKTLALIAAAVAVCMVNEQETGRNIFGFLGGVSIWTAIREGKLRSQGAFEVYVTAGAFGASLLPLFVSLLPEGKSKATAILGIVGSTIITVTSNTSTALAAYGAGIVGLCFWPLRKQMRTFRRCLAITLVALHLYMKSPVWALINRIDLTGSSSSYHRYLLMDNCIRHFFSWCLIGAKDFQTWGSGMFDVSNEYVAYAETGGLLAVTFFIAAISRSFGSLGRARKRVEGDRKQEWFLWCLCAALLAHVAAYFGISYFDQVKFAWYLFLAIVSAVASEATRSSAPQVREALALSPETTGLPDPVIVGTI